MDVRNTHRRRLPGPPGAAGALIDALASDRDALWPRDRWPAMRLDRQLGPGAAGGHGPIRYVVEAHEPARSVRFRFTAPRGFAGTHAFTVAREGDGVVLEHVVQARLSWPAVITWPLVFRPLHDALLEDAMDRAELALTGTLRRPARWSWWVRMLRKVLGSRRSSR